ncbi:hypothetical protein L8C07_21955 [Paenibacillus sp. CMAA1739]|uniref:hypothetical protein n=1 Tax=Paenibacillus ottowii TaxID=2315729 RepID=UPI002730411E|nr:MULTISPECIES: hypothetical protein [Paenibacillus]MDP1512634.1 hypothetical protein [Paenibacillus ottowii]MEC4568619.1 hypothetical protein [Paenibacillus sp. CMAA1739]
MKKGYYTLTSAVVASLILTAVPVSTVYGASTKNTQPAQAATGASSLKEVDAKIVQKAQEYLKAATGKSYTFSGAKKWSLGNENGWDFSIKGVEHGQVMVTKKGELERIYVDQSWGELKDSYKQQLQAALKSVLQEPEASKTPEEVNISVDKSKGAVDLYTKIDNNIIILREGKVLRTIKLLAKQEIDENALKAASGVFAGLEGVKQGALNEPTQLITENGKTVYNLMFGTGAHPVFVNVEKGTNKVTKVAAYELQDPVANYKEAYKKMKSYSEAQLLKNAAGQSKELLKVDLTGYKATLDPKLTAIVHFTKSGSPSLVGSFNSKGQFYELEFKE